MTFAPQERRQLIANDSVENTACLLCIYQIDINIARVLDTRADRLLGDLVKRSRDGILVLELEQLLDVPRNRFSLAVRVSCEIDEIALADFAADSLMILSLPSIGTYSGWKSCSISMLIFFFRQIAQDVPSKP